MLMVKDRTKYLYSYIFQSVYFTETMHGAILWVQKYRNLWLTGTISHFTKWIKDRELTQADQKF